MRRLFSVVSDWFVYHGLPIVFLCLLLKNVSLTFNFYFNLDCYSVYKYGEIYVSEQWRNWKQLKDYTTTESKPICLLCCLGDTGSGGAEVDLHHRLLCFRVLLCSHCPHIPGLVEVCATSVNYTMQKTLRRIRICLLSHVLARLPHALQSICEKFEYSIFSDETVFHFSLCAINYIKFWFALFITLQIH